jgi:hypothetical protein
LLVTPEPVYSKPVSPSPVVQEDTDDSKDEPNEPTLGTTWLKRGIPTIQP